MESSIAAGIFVVGNILFGHFEEGAPKWKRVAKFFLTVGLVALISATAGRAWVFVFIGAMLVGAGVIHGWWLPRQGIVVPVGGGFSAFGGV